MPNPKIPPKRNVTVASGEDGLIGVYAREDFAGINWSLVKMRLMRDKGLTADQAELEIQIQIQMAAAAKP